MTSVTGGGLDLATQDYRDELPVGAHGDHRERPPAVVQREVQEQHADAREGGKTLKNKFPRSQEVPIKIQNPDGTSVTTSYTRP